MKRTLALLVLAMVVVGARPSAAGDTLSFFKNYFLTGDYAVGGASLWRKGVNGTATAQIAIAGVPAGADIEAAFLYVQTAEKTQWSGIDHATFNGFDLGPGNNSAAKALNWDNATCPCWSVAFPGGRRLVTYRADVLRFLPIGSDGKYNAQGPHTIQVPDSGTAFGDDDELGSEIADSGPRAIGASLVIVYRDTDPTRPLRGIIIYDGGVTRGAFATWSQTLSGFYEASLTNPAARVTPIVGDGRPFLSEKLRIDGQTWRNPFVSALGPKWDNPEFRPALTPGAASTTISILPDGLLSDCVSLSAIVMSTVVQDADDDGLLDVWESSTTPLLDPNGQPLPNLAAMGADPRHKDLFLEIGYMKTDTDLTYGGVLEHAHSHLPPPSALKSVGDAFRDAPVPNPDGTTGINLHVDAGDGYPAGEADPYMVRGAGLARGGEAIDETVTVCARGASDPPWVCQFSDYPGTVGWKTSFKLLQTEVLNGPVPAGDDPCNVPGTTCRFDRNRKDIFHYVLFGHAVGLPKSEDPSSPDFHVPVTNTGIGDFPGGDVMVTLGAFADSNGNPVGSPFMQASTLMHELGHNLERRHGGDAFEPNCKPTYLSVMNYLYQLRGLLDDEGTPHLDFARGEIDPAVGETSLVDGLFGGQLPYRIGWYAPLATSYLNGHANPVARHCDGTPLLPTDVPMVRLDAQFAASPIDWAGDNATDGSPFTQDVNFSGSSVLPDLTPEILRGSDDWSKIRLDQVGGRRDTGALFVEDSSTGLLAVGPLSLDAGRGDLGRGDLGRGDLGRGDLGRGDLGRGDLGRGDLGRGDLGRGDLGRGDLGNLALGRGDLGRGDLGGGDLFVGNPFLPSGELDFETASDLAKTEPLDFTAFVIMSDQSGQLHDVQTSWTTPNVGGLDHYTVFRVPGASLVPGQPWTQVGVVPSVPGQTAYSFVDTSHPAGGQTVTYFAVANDADNVQSDPSNLITLTTVNSAPVATGQNVATNEDTALNIALSGVDPEAQPLTFAVVSTPGHGTLSGTAPNLSYTPASNYNGPDAFTFTVNDGTQDSAPATVSITVNPVDDAPVAGGDGYSLNENAALTIAAPGVLGNDADIDGPSLTAILVSGPSHGTLALHTDGSFTYTPASGYYGADSFTYRANDGTLDSNVAQVALTVVQTVVPYSLVNVRYLPAALGVTFKPNAAGTLVDFDWRFAIGGTTVNSADAAPSVTILGPNGYNRTFSTGAGCVASNGCSKFTYTSGSKQWDFDWKPVNAAVGTYYVVLSSGKTGQRFPDSGPGFSIVFKK